MRDAVTVIIPTLYDPLVAEVVAHVQTQLNAHDEIVVVGKIQDDCDIESEQVRFIDTGNPVTAPVARNRGIRAADSKLLAFIDADCLPEAGWLDALLGRICSGEDVVIGSVKSPTDNYWVLAYNLSMFHEFMPDSQRGLRRHLPTLNLAVRRTVIDRIGGMDEELARGQDVEWGVRMALAGYRLFFEPNATVTHHPLRRNFRTVWKYWFRTGRFMGLVRQRYADYFRTPALLGKPFWVRLLSPLIAAYVTAAIFWRSPRLGRYIYAAPALFLSKLAWCWGAAKQGIEQANQEVEHHLPAETKQ